MDQTWIALATGITGASIASVVAWWRISVEKQLSEKKMALEKEKFEHQRQLERERFEFEFYRADHERLSALREQEYPKLIRILGALSHHNLHNLTFAKAKEFRRDIDEWRHGAGRIALSATSISALTSLVNKFEKILTEGLTYKTHVISDIEKLLAAKDALIASLRSDSPAAVVNLNLSGVFPLPNIAMDTIPRWTRTSIPPGPQNDHSLKLDSPVDPPSVNFQFSHLLDFKKSDEDTD